MYRHIFNKPIFIFIKSSRDILEKSYNDTSQVFFIIAGLLSIPRVRFHIMSYIFIWKQVILREELIIQSNGFRICFLF